MRASPVFFYDGGMTQLPHCHDPHIRDFRCPPESAAAAITDGLAPRHDHASESEHLFGFKYWHFFDITSDIVRSATKSVYARLQPVAQGTDAAAHTARRVLPALRVASRALPVVGVAGELMHVATPFEHAREDYRDGKISTLKFSGLCALYGVYTITGLGGFLTAGIKEGLTNAAQRWNWMDEQYIPHSLYQEFQHAGWFGGAGHLHDHDHEHPHAHGASAPVPRDRQIGPSHFHALEDRVHCAVCAATMAKISTTGADAAEQLLQAPRLPLRLITRVLS